MADKQQSKFSLKAMFTKEQPPKQPEPVSVEQVQEQLTALVGSTAASVNATIHSYQDAASHRVQSIANEASSLTHQAQVAAEQNFAKLQEEAKKQQAQLAAASSSYTSASTTPAPAPAAAAGKTPAVDIKLTQEQIYIASSVAIVAAIGAIVFMKLAK
ncbi:hypothetical protein BDR26DRAFT_858214 [Obelidium mucronatum]|nr:hypothetical protein BDR26DRAFT_858214 [Obelidium mucronatum]